MSAFLIVAALMAAIAAAIVAVPLLRDKRSRIIGALAACLVAGAAAGLYPLWSNWDWHAPVQAPSMPAPDVLAMVAKLEQHMRDDPNDLAGWLMMPLAFAALWLELGLLGRLFIAVPTAAGPVPLTLPQQGPIEHIRPLRPISPIGLPIAARSPESATGRNLR